MFERLARSWKLVNASGSVLMQDQELLVFPAISAVAVIVVSLCFLFPALGLLGITDIEFVYAEGLATSAASKEAGMAQAQKSIARLNAKALLPLTA